MTCLENIVILSTMFIVLVAVQTTKTEGNLISREKKSHIYIDPDLRVDSVFRGISSGQKLELIFLNKCN